MYLVVMRYIYINLNIFLILNIALCMHEYLDVPLKNNM